MSNHQRPTEAGTIARAQKPATVASLARDLRALGLDAGMTVLVHASLSALGWVNGGAQAVILALLDVLTPSGTLVMPAHSADLSDPAAWQNPPVPEAWWSGIRETMPPFDPALTPTRGMGKIAETFRKAEGALRSSHPQTSFAALGPDAAVITGGHRLESMLGEESPLARLYALDGWVLLLGVGHGRNTSLHLAEYRADFPGKQYELNGAPVLVDGARQWVTVHDIDLNDADFPQIGAAYEAAGGAVRAGSVALAAARLMRQRPLVDFAVQWMEQHRG